MSNPFADASVAAASVSSSSSSSSLRTSSSSAGGGASASAAPASRPSLYEETLTEVTKNPMMQEFAKVAVAGAVANNVNSLFANKAPGISAQGGAAGAKGNYAVASSDGGAATVNAIDVDPAELHAMQQWSQKLRTVNIGVCALLMIASFFSLGSNDLSLVFIALYVWFFAGLLCCYELGLSAITQFIAINFGFMYNSYPRKIFVILVAILCYGLGLFGKIAMALLLGSECCYAYVQYKHPKFEKYMKITHLYGSAVSISNAVEQTV